MKLKNLTIEKLMYGVLLALALVIPLSTALTSILIGIGSIGIIFKWWQEKKRLRLNTRIFKVLVIYFLCQILVAILSWEPLISLREVFGEMHRFLPLFLAINFVREVKQLRNVLIVSLFSFLVNDLMGIFQYFFQNEPRAFGFNHTPTFFGSFMLMQIPVSVFCAQLKILKKFWRKFSIVISLLSLLCLVLSMTRGAWLAFVGIILVYIFIDKNCRKLALKIFIGMIIISSVVTIFSPRFQERLSTLGDLNFQSNRERLLMWESAIEIFKDYPIHGIGQKMFVKAYNEHYISPEAKERPEVLGVGHTQPHNNLLNEACRGGLIGLAAFFCLYGYFFKRFFKQMRSEKFLTFGAGATAFLVLLGLQLEGLTDTNMTQVPIMREFWFLVGIFIKSEDILKGG